MWISVVCLGMTTIDAIADVCLGEKTPVDIFAGEFLILEKNKKINLNTVKVMAEAFDRGMLKMALPIAMERIKRRLSS